MLLKYGYTTKEHYYQSDRQRNTSGTIITDNLTLQFNSGIGEPEHFIELQKKAAAKDKAENILLGMAPGTIQHQTAKVWSAEIREGDFHLAAAAAVARDDGVLDVTPNGIKAAQTLMQSRQQAQTPQT